MKIGVKKRSDQNPAQSLSHQQWIEGWKLGIGPAAHRTHLDSSYGIYLAENGLIGFGEKEKGALSLDMELNDRIVHLFDGLIIYNEKKRKRSSIELIVIEDGILYGKIINRNNPKLIPAEMVNTSHQMFQIESFDRQTVLQQRDCYFCCIHTHLDHPNLSEKFDHIFDIDFEVELENRLVSRVQQRVPASQSKDQNELHFLCIELMQGSLQPSSERIQGLWSNNRTTHNEAVDVNTTLIQILAWAPSELEIAESLLTTILRLQTSSGSIPSAIDTKGLIIDLAAPKPIICMVAEEVLSKRKDPDLIATMLPKLARYLSWILSHFDPTRRGIHRWRNQSEPLEKDIYETELATADLSALLLNEIESLERIASWQQQSTSLLKQFYDDKTRIISNLENLFWNESKKDYSIAWAREKKYVLDGYGALLPMMCKSLKKGAKEVMIERLQQGELTGKTLHHTSWREIDLSNDELPILQKILFIKALAHVDPGNSIVYDYLRLSMSGFIDFYIAKQKQVNQKSITLANAAYVMLVNYQYDQHYQIANPLINSIVRSLKRAKIDRVDLSIFASVAILLIGVRTFYALQESPQPLSILQTEMHIAYNELDFLTTIETATQIMEHYPEEASRARLYQANIALQFDNPEVALQMLTPLRERFPDSPGPMLLEAISLHQLQRFEDASQCYFEFCYLFDEIFPKIVEDAKFFHFLLQEQLALPNNWRVIYGHRICHEI